VTDVTKEYAERLKALHARDELEPKQRAEEELRRENMSAEEIMTERAEKAKREAELHAHKFTLAEDEVLRRELTPGEYHKLEPYIRASNERGDFRYPTQMARAEFKGYCEERGRPGPVFDMLEHGALGADASQLNSRYSIASEHLKSAFRDGRIMHGPNGQALPFADEVNFTPEERTARLEVRYGEMKTFYDAKQEVEKLTGGLRQLEQALKTPGGASEYVTLPSITAYLASAVRSLQRNHKSKEFPLENIKGYSTLVAERDEGRAACKRKGISPIMDFGVESDIEGAMYGTGAENG
jgi:hypothetical protein